MHTCHNGQPFLYKLDVHLLRTNKTTHGHHVSVCLPTQQRKPLEGSRELLAQSLDSRSHRLTRSESLHGLLIDLKTLLA